MFNWVTPINTGNQNREISIEEKEVFRTELYQKTGTDGPSQEIKTLKKNR